MTEALHSGDPCGVGECWPWKGCIGFVFWVFWSGGLGLSGPYTVFIALIALLDESAVAFLVISAPVTELERWRLTGLPIGRGQKVAI